ncbi:DUF6153 family protein [Microbacterium aquimaris]|uniref:DUF6153 family protein n=1 Tax=Microbacterium aquimaris TaxID=459816 RepID=UPI002AD2BEFB|nr:DUF6153 family protein [Microbacterium aquimaris]MDZ8276577.1 DUF6153 family protein [Microbacterium aquimaris]
MAGRSGGACFALRWLWRVILAVAIAFGVFAMHSGVSAPATDHAPIAATAASHHTAEPTAVEEPACAGCVAPGGHEIAAAMCLFILLSVGLWLAPPQLSGLRISSLSRQWIGVLLRHTRVPVPLSLHQLSISRI